MQKQEILIATNNTNSWHQYINFIALNDLDNRVDFNELYDTDSSILDLTGNYRVKEGIKIIRKDQDFTFELDNDLRGIDKLILPLPIFRLEHDEDSQQIDHYLNAQSRQQLRVGFMNHMDLGIYVDKHKNSIFTDKYRFEFVPIDINSLYPEEKTFVNLDTYILTTCDENDCFIALQAMNNGIICSFDFSQELKYIFKEYLVSPILLFKLLKEKDRNRAFVNSIYNLQQKYIKLHLWDEQVVKIISLMLS